MPDERQQAAAISKALERAAERVITKITLDATANLVETTPVDTGWARANWVPTIGAPGDEPVGEPGSPAAGQAARVAGEAQVLTYRIANGRVTISNNVPYIEALNDGHSQQEPAGFVERAINKAVTQDIAGLGGLGGIG